MITREQLDKKTRITLMALKTYQTRTFLTVLQRQSQERLILENNFRKDFIKLVREYEEKVLYTYTSSTMKGLSNHNIIVLLRIANQDFKEKYNKLLYKHLLLVEKNARNQTDELIKLQTKKRLGQKQEQISFKDQPLTWLSKKAKDIQTKLLPNKKNKPYVVRENKKVKQYLRDHALTVSQKTAERIDKNIQEILTRSETEGTNSRGVAKHITQKFKQLKTWEAERIARTEINAANNLVTHNRLLENGLVDYKQWVSAEDSRVRKSHKKLNTEIARIGEPFSNGLMYPGDHNGPLEEFINCRCTLVPYIPDFDKIAPTDMTTWHEEDMQRLPTNTGQQIILQLNEQQKLYKVMDGYMKLYPDKITLKPGNVQTTLDRLINKLPLDYHTKTQTMYKTPSKENKQSTLDKIINIIKPKPKTKVVDMKMPTNSTATLIDRSTSNQQLKPIDINYTRKPSGNPKPTFIKQLTKNEYYTKTINNIQYYVIKKSKINKFGEVLYNKKVLNIISEKFNATTKHLEGINTPEGATYHHTKGSKRFNIFISQCYNPITKKWNTKLIKKYKNMKKCPNRKEDEVGYYLYKVINNKHDLMGRYMERADNMSKNIKYVQGNIMVSAGTKDISFINVEGKSLREIKEGEIIHLSNFQSTSIDESVTKKFTEDGNPPTVIHIGLSDGTPVIPALKNSADDSEQEIILQIGTGLRRVGKIEYKGGEAHVWFEIVQEDIL